MTDRRRDLVRWAAMLTMAASLFAGSMALAAVGTTHEAAASRAEGELAAAKSQLSSVTGRGGAAGWTGDAQTGAEAAVRKLADSLAHVTDGPMKGDREITGCATWPETTDRWLAEVDASDGKWFLECSVSGGKAEVDAVLLHAE